MYKFLFVAFLLLSIDSPLQAKYAPPTSLSDNRRSDTSNVDVRVFNQAALDQYRKNPDFNYYIDDTNKRLSWWDRFWRWIWDQLAKLFERDSPKGETSPIIKYISLVVVIVLLVYVIIKLLGKDLAHLFSKKSKDIIIPYSIASEDIHQITFDEEIARALQQRNYRLAIRFLYLRSLKQLSDANLIHWQIDKTNTAYLNEIQNTEQRQLFGVITRQFEYVWYGDFPVNETSYQNINTLFQDFKQQVA